MQAVAKRTAKVNRSQALRRPQGRAERREVRKNFGRDHMRAADEPRETPLKKIQKTFQKPLDKPKRM